MFAGAKIAEMGAYEILNGLQENVMEHSLVSNSIKVMVDEVARQYPHSDLMDSESRIFFYERV